MQDRNYLNKESDVGKLTAELVAAGLVFNSRFFGATYVSGSVATIVYVADDFSQEEGTTCDAVVAAHVALTVAEAKIKKNAAIDQRTKGIISLGISYDDHVFSMEESDQLNYISLCLACMADQLTFPAEVRDLSDQPYSLADAEAFYAFFFSGLGYVQAVLAGGRAIKDQVNACDTIECVNSIVDPR